MRVQDPQKLIERMHRVAELRAIMYDTSRNWYDALTFAAAHGNILEPDFIPTQYDEPTDAQPGSAEKQERLAARIARGQHMWHPDDRRTTSVRRGN